MKTSDGLLLLVTLLTIVAQPFDCSKQIRSRDYRDYLIRDDSIRTSILQALTDLSVTDEMSVEEIGERIVAASAHTHQFRHIYLSLAELANTNHTECSPETISLCLSIMGQSRLQTFWKFVEASRDRLHKCARESEQKILDRIEKNGRMRQIVGSLDSFVKKAMGVSDDMPNLDYLAELKKFDMTKDRIKSRQLLIAIDRSRFYFNRGKFDFSPIARIERFLTDRCMPFRFVLRNWLDSINLDLLLGNELLNPEIDRISEYHRICVDWVLRRSRISRNLWKGFLSM